MEYGCIAYKYIILRRVNNVGFVATNVRHTSITKVSPGGCEQEKTMFDVYGMM